MASRTFVIATVSLPGFHRWPAAATAGVAYLEARHRHLFGFRVHCLVNHDDRAVEFHTLQSAVVRALVSRFGEQPFEFQDRSCERIATDLHLELRAWGVTASVIEVWEDGENGARVEFD